ncbi:dienelactone hydrolase family protein [Kitasatospora sp. NBC_00374]|uniref:alpha/beta hydrolase family protein n=1 Tax=Kitasatospora sp. NBC_00374 TaxID=2975964 RepID=UPI0030DF5A56
MKRVTMSAAGLAAAGLLLAGCGGPGGSGGPAGPAGAPSASASAVTYGCLTKEQGARGAVSIPSDVSSVDAYYRDSDAGGARVAIVLSHQNGGSLCDWVPYLDGFTAAGYAVLPFTANGDVATGIESVAGYLKSKGIARLVLIGASKGGTGSLVAAALPSPLPVAAVVSLSGPESFGADNAATAVKRLKVPVLFAAEEHDSTFPADARSLHAAAASADKQLRIYPGGNHGAQVLGDGALPDVQSFLATYAPPAG